MVPQTRSRATKASRDVILWADTFNNYFFPETAQAAVEVLEHSGYQVRFRMQHLCCGRPLYDYGFLDMAKQYLTPNLDGARARHRCRDSDGGSGAELLLRISRRIARPVS